MTHDEIIDAWNKQADYMNKWNYLGEDEKLEWAMKLERKACAQAAAIALLGADRELAKRVVRAIRARGQA